MVCVGVRNKMVDVNKNWKIINNGQSEKVMRLEKLGEYGNMKMTYANVLKNGRTCDWNNFNVRTAHLI